MKPLSLRKPLWLLLLLSATLHAQVIQQWAQRYGTPGLDQTSAIATDLSGNVYVTGSSYSNGSRVFATLKYNAFGQMQWQAFYYNTDNIGGPVAIGLDAQGNVYVGGTGQGCDQDLDYVVIKYNSVGVQLWVQHYRGIAPASIEQAGAMVVDAAGNTYITGSSQSSTVGNAIATVKLSTNGVQLWAQRYPVAGIVADGRGIALDPLGNVVVTGTASDRASVSQLTTIKYLATGVQQWVQTYSGPAGGIGSFGRNVKCDAQGNVYVTGDALVAEHFSNYAVLKYDANGNQKWVSLYAGPTQQDYPIAILVDGSGNSYVTGGSAAAGGYNDLATVKFDPNGNQLWVARYNGPADKNDYATAMAMDQQGNIYVTGASDGGASSSDFVTLMYTPQGQQQWVVRYNGPANAGDQANAIAVSAAGSFAFLPGILSPVNVYVTGVSQPSAQADADYLTVKYISFPSLTTNGGLIGAASTPAFSTIGQKVPVPSVFKFSGFPNPASHNMQFIYELPFDSKVLLRIYDMQGREVGTLAGEEKKAGRYSVDFDVSNLRSGVYDCKLIASYATGQFVQSEKVTVQR